MGPVLSTNVTGAGQLVRRLLTGQVPGLLNICFPIVDVRDVAAAHVTAMTSPARPANGSCWPPTPPGT